MPKVEHRLKTGPIHNGVQLRIHLKWEWGSRSEEIKKKHGIDEVQGEIKENPYLDQLE